MSRPSIVPTGRESPLAEEELIVTKTDPQGRILYANDVFMRVSRYRPRQVLGAPHNLVRHPEMPRCIFQLFWETLQRGEEFFGFVLNLAGNGDHYWVFAHATPSRDAQGQLLGYHSNRRRPDPAQVARIQPIYRQLLRAEAAASDRKLGLQQGSAALQQLLGREGASYERFVFSL